MHQRTQNDLQQRTQDSISQGVKMISSLRQIGCLIHKLFQLDITVATVCNPKPHLFKEILQAQNILTVSARLVGYFSLL